MDIICPSCKTKMDALTNPQGEGRRHYRCPLCEGEYVIPSPSGVVEAPAAMPARGAEKSSSPPTIPGFTVGGVPGAEWQVPEELQFSLRVLEGSEAGKVFAVNRSRVTVGREEGDILLGDPLVSRKHAAFEVFGSHHIVVKDLASTNGTYLNGRLIAYSKLNNGDKIKIGSSVLEAVIQIAE
jgi:FHA domain-containing protein